MFFKKVFHSFSKGFPYYSCSSKCFPPFFHNFSNVFHIIHVLSKVFHSYSTVFPSVFHIIHVLPPFSTVFPKVFHIIYVLPRLKDHCPHFFDTFPNGFPHLSRSSTVFHSFPQFFQWFSIFSRSSTVFPYCVSIDLDMFICVFVASIHVWMPLLVCLLDYVWCIALICSYH